MTTKVTSFQQEKARRDEAALASQQRAVAEEDLKLLAHLFEADEITGYCTTLTAQGLAWYTPKFATYGVSLQGSESFRQLQYLRDQILDNIYDETAELAKTVREGKVSGAELQFTAAALDGDFMLIRQTAEKLATELTKTGSSKQAPGGQVVQFNHEAKA